MFFKNIRKRFSSEDINLKRQQEVEDEFSKGNIMLPTGLIDYKDYKELKEKTSHIPNIKKELLEIEKNGK